MHIRLFSTLAIVATILLMLGCSGGGGNVSAPDVPQESSREISGDSSQYLWGYWQGVIDPVNQTVEFIRMREGNFHLNALGFLEPPPLLNITIESLEFNGNFVTVDIGMRHPFLGLTEFTGYDVCGIFITNGSISGFTDPNLVMTGPGDMRLLNPDGLSRWWNPSEFPSDGSIFSYNDGLLGTKQVDANFTGTLNGYKYFCDDLVAPDDPMSSVDPLDRGVFSAGQKNVRRYELEIGNEGLVFNYAVAASWHFPDGSPPWVIPDDFGPEANRTEAWNVATSEIENTLYNDGVSSGGDLRLSIDVYDWFNADLNTIRVESPGNFAMVESTNIIGDGPGFSTYQVDIIDATPVEGSIDILLSIACEQPDFEGFITGTNTTAYFTTSATVGVEPASVLSLVWQNVVELVPTNTYGDPWDDMMSPAIAQETDNELKVLWFGFYEHDYGAYSNWYSMDIGGYSSNGTNWSGLSNTFGTSSSGGSFQRDDQAKIAPHQGGSCETLVGVFAGTYMTLFDTDRAIKSWPPYVFNWVPNRAYNCEVMADNSGYIYAVTDGGGTFNANKTSGPNQAGGSNPYVINSGSDGRLSHVRSWGCDTSNILWLTYGKTSLDGIYLAYGNNSSNTSWTDNYLVWSDSAYTDVRDPSMHLVNGEIYLSFTRRETSSGDYQLVYTHGNITDDFITPIVIDTSSSPIEDAHLQFSTYVTHDIIGAGYMKEDAIYFAYSPDNDDNWQPPELVQTVSEVAYDPDMIFINHVGGLTEDLILIWIEGLTTEAGCFTRMAHWVEN